MTLLATRKVSKFYLISVDVQPWMSLTPKTGFARVLAHIKDWLNDLQVYAFSSTWHWWYCKSGNIRENFIFANSVKRHICDAKIRD